MMGRFRPVPRQGKSQCAEPFVSVLFAPLAPARRERKCRGMEVPMDLSGKILIAMPGMGDPRFDHSVVFICAHSDEGAMGIIINKPAHDLTFRALMKQLGITATENMRDIRVHMGGPVELTRGFVLHSCDYEGSAATLKVNDRFGMTTTLDILEFAGRWRRAGPVAAGTGLCRLGQGATGIRNCPERLADSRGHA